MKRSSGSCKTANLSKSAHQQLSMYALAASAAGVGTLILAQPALAKVVYTPANIKIVQNGGLITFDLNHDGIPDFGLSNKFTSFSSNELWTLKAVQTRQANEIREGLPCYEKNCVPLRCLKARRSDWKANFNRTRGRAYS